MRMDHLPGLENRFSSEMILLDYSLHPGIRGVADGSADCRCRSESRLSESDAVAHLARFSSFGEDDVHVW